MRRFKQEISRDECIELLKNEKRGVLSLLGDDGYPYGIPLNHWYSEDDNALYFHGAKEGHKIDSINRCDKASYCVYDRGYREDGEWAYKVKSVIVFGRISTVGDTNKKIEICSNLCRKFTDDDEYLKKELENDLSRVNCLKLEIEHMSGKLVRES